MVLGALDDRAKMQPMLIASAESPVNCKRSSALPIAVPQEGKGSWAKTDPNMNADSRVSENDETEMNSAMSV